MMRPRAKVSLGGAAALVALLLLPAAPAHAIRVVSWNLFTYPDYNIAVRQPYFRTVMSNINADVVVVQELLSQAGRDSFLINVLNVVEPGQWSATNFRTLQAFPVEGGAFFWKPAKVAVAFDNQFTTSGPRDVLFCRVTPVGYTALSATFRIYSVHLKAGTSCSPLPCDSTTRRQEATDIRATLNAVPVGTHFLLGGDTNIYGAYEGAYIRLTESQPDNDGRGKDPLTMPGNWHNVPGYSPYLSQCPCLTSCGSFSGGGMDDRFDLFLSTYDMQDGEGVDLASGGYFAYGNDGNHYNDDIDGGGFNTAVGLTVATALKNASDHLPVVFTVSVASKLATASQLDFGSVIIGGTAQQTLSVSNPAIPPADDLDYWFSTSAGFTAPGGSFSANAGAIANDHTITMSTASTGVKTGRDTVRTDAPDSLTKIVLLSGRVLDHAIASLDSAAIVLDDTLDFGALTTSEFRDSTVRVHDRGYNALQAQLAVNAGVITGGGGHFSIVGGFSPVTVGAVGHSYTVRFDTTSVTEDSTYSATLTFSTADEPLPGATAQSSLVVHLVARAVAGAVDVRPGDGGRALRFYPARPNPLSGETHFAVDLPEAATVSLAVFDLSGRRVANIVNGGLDPGHHELTWYARRDGIAPGLYFARIQTRGLMRTQRLVVLP